MTESKVFQECGDPNSVTIIVGGDYTTGYIPSRHDSYITPEQWDWIKRLMNNANDFDPIIETPPFKCSCCGRQLKGGPGGSLRHYLALNLHHPSVISFDTFEIPRHSFLLCGDSKERGCVCRILDILRILSEKQEGGEEKLLRIIEEVKRS